MTFHPPIPDPKGRSQGSGLVSALVQAEKLVQIALILPCSAFIGWLIGDWIGNRAHMPLLGAVGVAFGGAAGLFYVIRLALAAVKDPASTDKNSTDKNDPGGTGSAGGPS